MKPAIAGFAFLIFTKPVPEPPMLIVARDCWGAEDRSRPFNGTMSMNGGTIEEQIGRRGRERVIQSTRGDLRLCMVTSGFDGEPDDHPSQWLRHSDRVIFETRTPNDVRTMDVDNGRITYTVNGAVHPIDAAAQEWRDDLLGLLDVTWDLGQLRGRVSSLRGEISSIQGTRSSLEGQISSLRGQVSSMQGEISSIRGHESSLRGQISSERGSISNLRAMTWERAREIDVDARIRSHEENIQRIEREIREYDADGRVREVERRLREFDVEEKVARTRRQIAELDVDDRVKDIERDIRSLDAPARTRDLEERRNEAFAALAVILRRAER